MDSDSARPDGLSVLRAAEVPASFTGKVIRHDRPLAVRVLRDTDELRALAPAWNRALPARGVTPMQEHSWCLSCAEALLDRSRLAVVCVTDDSGLRALAPMRQSRTRPFRCEQLGISTLQEPGDLLYTDAPALHYLLDSLAGFRRPLVLGRLPSDAATVTAARKVLGRRGLVKVRPGGRLPYIGLQGVDDADALLSRRLLSDLRRARRKAEAAGRVSFEIHQPRSAAQFLPLFGEALKVESASWKGRSGTDLGSDRMREDFFRRYGTRAAQKGSLHLAFLRVGARPVAMQFAVEMNRRFWLLKISYDHGFSNCSPGHLLMLETLRFAHRRGLASYEFLGSTEPWTRRWTRQERNSVRIEAYPFTASGVAAFGNDLGRRAWNKAGQVLGQARRSWRRDS